MYNTLSLITTLVGLIAVLVAASLKDTSLLYLTIICYSISLLLVYLDDRADKDDLDDYDSY